MSQQQVLIIEDDQTFRSLLERKLRSFIPEMQVTVCETLAKARKLLDSLNQIEFDLVILDQHLPDGRGVELLQEQYFEDLAVLSVSSDTAPEIPGATIQAGAAFFLAKRQITEPLFQPLVLGLIDRNRLQRQLTKAKIDAAIIDTVKTLVGTLRHEINNPLGAVLGAAYLLRNNSQATPEQLDAAELVETSGQRIKHVLEQLSSAITVEPVNKANHKVFHIPGDEPWGKE